MSTPEWTAGARSIEPLEGDGYFRFLVPAGVTGVSVGIGRADTSTDPMEPSHGILFSPGRFRVFTSAGYLSGWIPYANDTAFYIGREGGVVYFATSTSESLTPDFDPWDGYEASEESAIYVASPVVLDAALLMPGDCVNDAAMFAGPRPPQPPRNSVTIAVPMLRIYTLDLPFAAVSAGLRIRADGQGNLLEADVRARSHPLVARAAQDVFNSAEIALRPLGVNARQWPLPTVVSARLKPMKASAREFGNMASVAVRPLTVRASEQSARWRIVLPAFQAGVPPIADVDDVALASDAVYPSHYALVVDGAFASDQLIAGAESVEMVEDTALASAEVVLGASVLLEDVALASDELPSTASTMLVVGTALAGDELLPQSTGSVLVTSGALAGGDALPYAFVDVEGVALASDDALIVSIVLLEDEALAGDEAITTSLRAQALLEDAALAGDELLAWTDSFALLQDVAVASEQLFMKTPGLVAWVMNTDTGAVSWYDNWAFTSMAVVGGKVFAAGPDGLHVIGGDLDGAEQIDARVQFGYTEFGGYDQTGLPKPSEPKKRVQALWFGYHADGALEATVETYGQGYGPYAYAMAPRAADQPRNNRIVPGKGLNARYWRIGVANTGGCAFEVHSIAAEVAQSTRRL